LSFKARKGGSNATLGSLRAAIISWSGTEDVITRDVVSGTSWGAAGTNPTLAANWTYENTPSNLALTTSYQDFKIENVVIDTASAKNVGVFIWTDDTNATVNDIVYLADINLVPGAVATSYMPRAFAQQRVMCGRFLPHWRADGASFNIIALGYSDSSTNTFAAVPFFTPARVAIAGAVVSAAGDFRVRASPGGTLTPNAITFNQGGVHACLVNITLASGSTAPPRREPISSSRELNSSGRHARAIEHRMTAFECDHDSHHRETKRSASRRGCRNRLRHFDCDGHFPRSTRFDAVAACRHARRRPAHGPRLACDRDEARAEAPGYALAPSVGGQFQHTFCTLILKGEKNGKSRLAH